MTFLAWDYLFLSKRVVVFLIYSLSLIGLSSCSLSVDISNSDEKSELTPPNSSLPTTPETSLPIGVSSGRVSLSGNGVTLHAQIQSASSAGRTLVGPTIQVHLSKKGVRAQ